MWFIENMRTWWLRVAAANEDLNVLARKCLGDCVKSVQRIRRTYKCPGGVNQRIDSFKASKILVTD